jgi:membrane protein
VPPGPSRTPAWVQRLLTLVEPLLGDWRVIRARAVLDRFGKVGGGLLAAGIAFNALFAIIPLAIFASGVIGILVQDPATQEAITDFLAGLAPPLASFLDTAIGDLANASTSLTIIGLVGAAWGATRLYASVELGIEAIFIGIKARSLVAKTFRRALFILIIAGLLAAAIVASTAGSIILGRTSATGLLAVVQAVALFVLPYIISVLAILIVYQVVPPVRPPRSALWPPAIGAGVLMVAITQVFTLIAPRLVSANPFWGTLGTVFVSLAWLNLISMILLIGAAWVRVRMLSDEEILAALS